MKNRHIAALTGGISTGKSTISKYFQQEFGFHIVDADQIGHEILGYPEIIDSISKAFGEETVFNGKIDRKALGKIVFSNPAKLLKLNEITHPTLIKRALDVLEKLNDKPVIFEAAVLIEAGWYRHFNTVILTTCSPHIQLKRTMERNHLSTNDAQARIDAQISDDARMQHSDFIIDTSSGLKPLKDRLNKIAQTLLMEI
jgi:dephospho-CoA kinase